MEHFDKIIIGGGLYGLYSALFCGMNRKREGILVLEYEPFPFSRSTYINQACVHMGYHYPRSFSTAIKSAHYFERFNKDFSDCILSDFDQVYAISSDFSWTAAEQFKKFCDQADIICDEIAPEKYFQKGKCSAAFLTKEYTYDAHLLKNKILNKIALYKNIKLVYNTRIEAIRQVDNEYHIILADGSSYKTSFVLNATYASVNQILQKLNFEPFKIKYELCEIILCNVGQELKRVGLTIMDGPFFSIMPFGKTGYHSLTSVTFTPHVTSYHDVPTFDCQKDCSQGFCSPAQLGNCNMCSAKPLSAWPYMSKLAKKFMKPELSFTYDKSLFSMKPILKASEIDDSRPTVIKEFSKTPTFISVLSGKINTVYDLNEVLLNG